MSSYSPVRVASAAEIMESAGVPNMLKGRRIRINTFSPSILAPLAGASLEGDKHGEDGREGASAEKTD